MKNFLNGFAIFVLTASVMSATVAYAGGKMETTVRSDQGDVKVTTDDRGTVVRDTEGNIGYTSGGTTKADHIRAVDMYKD